MLSPLHACPVCWAHSWSDPFTTPCSIFLHCLVLTLTRFILCCSPVSSFRRSMLSLFLAVVFTLPLILSPLLSCLCNCRSQSERSGSYRVGCCIACTVRTVSGTSISLLEHLLCLFLHGHNGVEHITVHAASTQTADANSWQCLSALHTEQSLGQQHRCSTIVVELRSAMRLCSCCAAHGRAAASWMRVIAVANCCRSYCKTLYKSCRDAFSCRMLLGLHPCCDP